MFRWVPYAMVRIAAFFAAGVLLGIYFPGGIETPYSRIILISLTTLYIGTVWLRKRGKWSVGIGIIGLMVVGLMGYEHVQRSRAQADEDHLLSYNGPIEYYLAEIKKPVEERERSWRYEAEVSKIFDGEKWLSRRGRFLLYVGKDAGPPEYFYGDKILIHGGPSRVEGPANPHQFNFQEYLSYKNIYHQDFVRSSQIHFVRSPESKDIRYYSYQIRHWASSVIKKYLPEQEESAIALALTLGVTDGIDNELQSAYAASGAMHVLAVSGLHVGIVYGIILLLFKPLHHRSWSRWVIAVVSIVALWSFAFITGLSPSVLRAVTMFSFIAIARPFGRSTNIYNTLAGSAFLLLLYDPLLIMSVGFQLSYLAVFGIVVLHRQLYLVWEPTSRALDWVWNMSCVSIAAQLATFLLGLLYFHQFPVYFLVSNLFVIPGATLILVTSLLLIAVSFVPMLGSLVSLILQGLIKALNFTVYSIEALPFSLIENIYLTSFQCWVLMIALCCLLLLITHRRFAYLIATLVLISIFSLSQWMRFSEEIKGEKLIVYNIPGHTGIETTRQGIASFYADADLVADNNQVQFHIQPNRLFSGIQNVVTHPIENQYITLLNLNEKTAAVVAKNINRWPEDIKIDYLIMSNNSFESLSSIATKIHFDKLILDSSNSKALCERFLKEANGNYVYSVWHQGAFVEKI